jgi:hypothetical protein
MFKKWPIVETTELEYFIYKRVIAALAKSFKILKI